MDRDLVVRARAGDRADAPIGSSPGRGGRADVRAVERRRRPRIRPETGTVEWTVKLGATTSSASPLVVAGLIVAGDHSGVVNALDPTRWRPSPNPTLRAGWA